MPIKGQSKTTEKRTCRPFTNNSSYFEDWTEPGKDSFSDYEVSKKVMYLLRHGKQVHREDGAIHFWRIKENLQKHFPYCPHWSDDKWKKSMEGGGGNKKRCQCCTCESGCAYHGITDFVTNTLMKVQHVAVSEKSVHNSFVPRTVIWTWRFILSGQT